MWSVLGLGLLLLLSVSVNASEVIRVGINSSYPPFETVDDQGHLSGFDIDLVNAWAQNQGVQVKFVNLPWPRLLESLSQGRVDMRNVSPHRYRSAYLLKLHLQEQENNMRASLNSSERQRFAPAVQVKCAVPAHRLQHWRPLADRPV